MTHEACAVDVDGESGRKRGKRSRGIPQAGVHRRRGRPGSPLRNGGKSPLRAPRSTTNEYTWVATPATSLIPSPRASRMPAAVGRRLQQRQEFSESRPLADDRDMGSALISRDRRSSGPTGRRVLHPARQPDPAARGVARPARARPAAPALKYACWVLPSRINSMGGKFAGAAPGIPSSNADRAARADWSICNVRPVADGGVEHERHITHRPGRYAVDAQPASTGRPARGSEVTARLRLAEGRHHSGRGRTVECPLDRCRRRWGGLGSRLSGLRGRCDRCGGGFGRCGGAGADGSAGSISSAGSVAGGGGLSSVRTATWPSPESLHAAAMIRTASQGAGEDRSPDSYRSPSRSPCSSGDPTSEPSDPTLPARPLRPGDPARAEPRASSIGHRVRATVSGASEDAVPTEQIGQFHNQ